MNPGKLASYVAYGVNTFVLRRIRPYLMGLVITDKCNLNCFYCESKNAGVTHFTWEQARVALEDGYRRGHRSLYFTGGEPMIWSDGGRTLQHLVDYARQLGFYDVFIFTNGTVPLDIERCNYIVTVDGPRRIHDNIRSGTYELVMLNVRNACTKAVFASITFSKENVDHMAEFVREVTALGIFRSISFNLLTHWPDVVEKHGISAERRMRLLDDLWAMKRAGYPIVLSRACYRAMRENNWKRPIPQIELVTSQRVFTCCRDIDNRDVCANCGYANCVEVSQILAMKPSAMLQVLKMVG